MREPQRPTWMQAALAAGVLAGALLAAGCGGGEATQGHKLYQRNCANCHGGSARGMPHLGQDLHQNEFVSSRSDEELLDFLKVGRPANSPSNRLGMAMPAKGGNPSLTDDELRDLVAFLRSLQ